MLSNISEKAIGRTYYVVCAPIPVATVTHDDMSFQVLITKVMIGDRKTVCLNHSPRQDFASIELRVCHQTIFPAGGSYASHLQPTLLRQTLTLVVSVRISHIAFRAKSISIREGTLKGAITRQRNPLALISALSVQTRVNSRQLMLSGSGGRKDLQCIE